ncbi:MAG: agmatinase [Bacteroidetes bacterium GWF2_40_14]|nr:MAG: agmatinase [Bacteroidetes bacterium GWF2_40_14]
MKIFNPNEIGIANGNYFALPYKLDDSEIAILSVPWDVTTSYRPGTHNGPEAIIDASLQVDLFDAMVPDAWEVSIGTVPVDESLLKKNKKHRKTAESIIGKLEDGVDNSLLKEELDSVNKASSELNQYVYKTCKELITKGKLVGIVGGDHSVPLGNMKAVSEHYEEFGILHIDAHADLRIAYEGFTYSHASVMYNALNEIHQISQLTQVGVRDFCQEESDIINHDPRIRCFTDIELKRNSYEGKLWKKQCEEIIASLPGNVYISFDIDGLSPELCPNTGTPVPGGISFREIDYLLFLLASSNKKIVGFDLCEVSPSAESEWDANVGARILYKLCIYSAHNKKNRLP